MSEVSLYYCASTFSFFGSSGRLFDADSGSFLHAPILSNGCCKGPLGEGHMGTPDG